jgi:hypothetical protein
MIATKIRAIYLVISKALPREGVKYIAHAMWLAGHKVRSVRGRQQRHRRGRQATDSKRHPGIRRCHYQVIGFYQQLKGYLLQTPPYLIEKIIKNFHNLNRTGLKIQR